MRRLLHLIFTDQPSLSRTIICFGWVTGLSLFFIRMTSTNLDNYFPVTADEVWIMSASYKLATQGVFGSDMYAGLFNADQHYFIALPIHHLLQAISFQMSGVGIAQARFISLFSAILLIWIVSWLVYRWYGLAVAIIAGLLLICWRSYLIGGGHHDYGLSLLEVARSGRYDLSAVTWIWLSILALDRLWQRPSRLIALAVGICSGLAVLTQFFGVFVLPIVAITGLRNQAKPLLAKMTWSWVALGLLLIILPYSWYQVRHYPDFIGQTLALKESRVQFDHLGFYLDNLHREPDRYHSVSSRWQAPPDLNEPMSRPLGPWLLMIGLWPALINLWRRLRQIGALGDQLLGLSLVVFVGLLALLEQTKAPLYAIVLLPSICILLAVTWVDFIRWLLQQDWELLLHLSIVYLTTVLTLLVAKEGLLVYLIDRQQAVTVSRYVDVGRQIDLHFTPGARVLGSERWWWALHQRHYLAVNNLATQWHVDQQQNGLPPEFSDLVSQAQVEFIIVNNNVRGDLLGYPGELQSQFWNFLSKCSTAVTEWTDNTYGRIEVYHIAPRPYPCLP